VRLRRLRDGCFSIGLIGVRRHTADDHRDRGTHGTLRRRRVDAELLADLIDLGRAEVLLYHVQ
jgi:hypothetical protein